MRTWVRIAIATAGVALLATTGMASASSAPPPRDRSTATAAARGHAMVRTTPDLTVGRAPLAPPVYQPDTETSLVPITPCRVVDTRAGGGQLAGKATRNFAISGTSGFPDQGGRSGGCGIPSGAVAVAMSITAVNPAAKGYLTAWPYGASRPVASTLNFSKNLTTNTGATLPISVASNPALSVYAGSGPLNVVIDVTGYYVKPLAGFISSTGSPYSGSSRILSAQHIGTGVYEVQFDRSIRYCSAVVTPYVSSYTASASTWYDSTRPDTVRVWLWDANGASVDQYFYITANC